MPRRTGIRVRDARPVLTAECPTTRPTCCFMPTPQAAHRRDRLGAAGGLFAPHAETPHALWLDSSHDAHAAARASYIATRPYQIVSGPPQHARRHFEAADAALRPGADLWRDLPPKIDAQVPGFRGGLAGFSDMIWRADCIRCRTISTGMPMTTLGSPASRWGFTQRFWPLTCARAALSSLRPACPKQTPKPDADRLKAKLPTGKTVSTRWRTVQNRQLYPMRPCAPVAHRKAILTRRISEIPSRKWLSGFWTVKSSRPILPSVFMAASTPPTPALAITNACAGFPCAVFSICGL